MSVKALGLPPVEMDSRFYGEVLVEEDDNKQDSSASSSLDVLSAARAGNTSRVPNLKRLDLQSCYDTCQRRESLEYETSRGIMIRREVTVNYKQPWLTDKILGVLREKTPMLEELNLMGCSLLTPQAVALELKRWEKLEKVSLSSGLGEKILREIGAESKDPQSVRVLSIVKRALGQI